MLRRAFAGVSGVLVLFHLWLFAGQAWDGHLFEPARLARWLVAAGLAVAVVRLRRRSVSILRDKKAVAIWLMAALLHGPAIAERLDPYDGSTLRQIAATLAQLTVASAACVLALIAWLIVRRRTVAVARVFLLASRGLRRGAPGPNGFLFAAPRPPPVA